jgi:enoyl-CoA hydratase/carnithine racemase
VSPSAAADVAFSGETLSAARARDLGLVDLVAEEGPALPLALQRAALYAERPIVSLAAAKRALASSDRLARLEDGLAREKESALMSFRDGTLAAGLASFHDHPDPPTSAGSPDRPQ